MGHARGFLLSVMAICVPACVAPPEALGPEAGPPEDATALRGEPVFSLRWSLDEPPGGESPPALVPFGDGAGARFGATGPSWYALPEEAAGLLRFQGAFTLELELVLEGRPPSQGALLSAWQTRDGSRSFELGVDFDQQPYLVVSGDGGAGEALAKVTSTRQLRFGTPQLLTAVFEPGKRLLLRQNGMETGRLETGVPRRAHPAEGPIWVGSRSGAQEGLAVRAIIGRLDAFDRALGAEATSAWAEVRGLDAEPGPFAPVRAITRGPGFHWFGYYDKHELDPTGRYVLGQQVDFELRLPTPSDSIAIGMVDLSDGDRWIPLGESRAWSWQQGCMLQWLPGSDSQVIFNDRQDSPGSAPLVSRILNVFTGEERSLPRPIYHLSPKGDAALGTDFHRMGDMYGVPPLTDTVAEPAPASSTLYHMDLGSGAVTELFTVAQIAAQVNPDAVKHMLTHIQWNPSGTRFLFYHRYSDAQGGHTRVLTASPDGSGLFVLAEELALSHYMWSSDEDVLIWSGARGGYAWFRDGVGYTGTLFGHSDGHQSFVPPPEVGAPYEWLLADTYPDASGYRTPFLYNLFSGELVTLGRFYHPGKYGGGAHRVDCHPRLDREGRFVVFDSPHEAGRQLYLIDISGLTRP